MTRNCTSRKLLRAQRFSYQKRFLKGHRILEISVLTEFLTVLGKSFGWPTKSHCQKRLQYKLRVYCLRYGGFTCSKLENKTTKTRQCISDISDSDSRDDTYLAAPDTVVNSDIFQEEKMRNVFVQLQHLHSYTSYSSQLRH